MRSLALVIAVLLSASRASALTFDEALARYESRKDHPFQLVVDPRRYANVAADYSYPMFHYMRRLTTIGPDGTERPAPLATVDALLEAEVEVMGEADRKCRAAGQMIHDDRLNDVQLSNGIVFVEGSTGFDRDTGAANAAVAAKNIGLALPRLLGNLFGAAAYQVDRQATGYETLKDAGQLFKADALQEPYRVELGAASPGWQHVYMVRKEYVAKAYVLAEPAAMRSFMRQFFRKGAGCQAYRVGE